MDEDKIINLRFGEVSDQPSSPDDVKIGVTREGHPVYERKDGTRYLVYPDYGTTIYTAKYNPNNTDWYNTGNIAVDENGRRFYGNTQEEAQLKYEAWKLQWLQTHGAWNTIDMINAVTGGIFNLLSPTLFGRNIFNAVTGADNWRELFLLGNNGLVPDGWAAEHPAWAAVINAGADIGVLGGPSLLRATGRLAANTGRGVATAVKNTPRVVRSIPENMIRVVDKGKLAAEYLKDLYNYNRHVHRINTRGNLYSGIPMPDLAVTDETIKAAIENIKRAYKANKQINPYDVRIVTKNLSDDALFKMNDEVLIDALASLEGSPKPKLLNRLFDGDHMNMAEIESIVGDKELIAGLPEDVRTKLLNGYDDLLYKNVQNAENLVEAARAARGKMTGSRYLLELDDIINSAEKPVPPTEGSATQAAQPIKAAAKRAQTLALKFKKLYGDMNIYVNGKKVDSSVKPNPIKGVNDEIGLGGSSIPLIEEAGTPTVAREIQFNRLSLELRNQAYPKSRFRVNTNATDWDPNIINKLTRKMPENMNVLVRHSGSNLYFYSPKAPWQNWVKAVAGLGAVAGVGLGGTTLWGLGNSVFSDAPAERYVDFGDGRKIPIPELSITADSLKVVDPVTGKLLPILRTGPNFRVTSVGAAEDYDALDNKIAAELKASDAPVDYNEEPNDSANIYSVINGY